MMKVIVDYPSEMDEFVIVERMTGRVGAVNAVMTTSELIALQRTVDAVYVDPALVEFVVRMVNATRQPKDYGVAEIGKYIQFGASPRASINLILAARALAYMRGRTHVRPQDVLDLTHDVLRHRLVLTYEALSDGITSDALITKVIERIPMPKEPLHEHVAANA